MKKETKTQAKHRKALEKVSDALDNMRQEIQRDLGYNINVSSLMLDAVLYDRLRLFDNGYMLVGDIAERVANLEARWKEELAEQEAEETIDEKVHRIFGDSFVNRDEEFAKGAEEGK
jgi:gamma-glutamyl phosphate reductase